MVFHGGGDPETWTADHRECGGREGTPEQVLWLLRHPHERCEGPGPRPPYLP